MSTELQMIEKLVAGVDKTAIFELNDKTELEISNITDMEKIVNILLENGYLFDVNYHRVNIYLRPIINKLVENIKNWDKKNIHFLLGDLQELGELVKLEEHVDLSDLPSEPIPGGIEDYPVWAMDKDETCLVGKSVDQIEHLYEILDWYKRK